MQIKKVLGVVLTDTNYGESSKILNIFTLEYGLLGVMSKGCRGIKSKLRSVSGKLSYGYFHIYYRENGLCTLISADILDPFVSIKSDIKKIGYATYISELVMGVIRECNDNDIFSIYINSLLKINEGYDPGFITNILEFKMLNFLGVMPIIDGCSICGSTKNIVTIDVTSGGFVCRECYSNQVIVNEKVISIVRLMYYVDISKISNIKISSEIKNEINKFITEYYDKYTGLYLSSKKFLESIKI